MTKVDCLQLLAVKGPCRLFSCELLIFLKVSTSSCCSGVHAAEALAKGT
jgi:hypothetical protein